jgi:segregation and condensation protein B
MSLKAKVEAIIYATEEPVTLNELSALLKDAALVDLRAEEEARLALNETVYDGPPPPGAEDDKTYSIEEAAAEIADEPSMLAGILPSEPVQPEQPAAVSEEDKRADEKEQLKAVKAHLSSIIDELIADYASPTRGMEIRQIASGYRMATKPEHHDVVVNFAKSLKPPVRLSLQALETLAVIAYKQPVTVPEISEIRGVDSAGVIATLLDRKLVTTGGRKQVIGRPILYKTTKEFLMRFGLKDIGELPSMEEFEKLGDPQTDMFSSSPPESASSDEPITEAVPEQNTSEPVTEAVPESSGDHTLVGERTVGEDGTYATEAEPGSPSNKS